MNKATRDKHRAAGQCRHCSQPVTPGFRTCTHHRTSENTKSARRNKTAHRKQYRKNRKKFILDAKNHPCVDCGNQYPPEVMQFDHVRGVKLFTISGSMSVHTTDEILAEIAKCDIRCPTCHCMRHYLELHPTQ